MTHRQIGLSEAVYRLFPFLHMKQSNTKCIFVPSGFPENRSVFFRKVTAEEADQDEFEEMDDGDSVVQIPGREGKFIQAVTLLERYSERPAGVEEICVAQFASLYQSCKTIPKKVIMTNGVSDVPGSNILFADQSIVLPKYIALKNKKMGYMSQRGSPCVLRLHNSKKKEGHEQYYADMLLFVP
jgi:hypothetical protein